MGRILFCILGGVFLAGGALQRAGRADTLNDTFTQDPVLAGQAVVTGTADRFTYDAATHAEVAHYDSQQPTALLLFPLAATLTQNTAFSFSTTLTIKNITNYDHTNPADLASFLGTAQVAFGLANTATTGTNRTDSAGNAFDLVTVDYFPTNNAFGTPSLDPTVVESAQPGHSLADVIDFPSGPDAALPTFLNTGVPITVNVSYDPATHVLTATAASTALFSGSGHPNTWTVSQDLDQTATAFDATGFSGFNVNAFTLALWNDSAAIDQGFDVPTTADVAFSNFSVTYAVPEPSSLLLLGLGALGLLRRRH